MHLFEYISQRSPKDALSVFKNWSNIRVYNEMELAEGFHALYQELSPENKQLLLTELAEIHPDRQMLEEIIAPEPIDDFSGANGHNCNCSLCNVKYGANGQEAVSHFMSNGDVQNLLDNKTQNINQELNNIKQEYTSDQKMNDKIFKLVIMAVVVYLAYRITKK